MEKPIIVITGPTASGKTALSLEIAGKYNGEIICADSMTVYRGMDIGTDKPYLQNTKGIPHHLIDVLNPDEEFNVALFVERARKLVDDIHSRGKVSFIVGGSLMYIDAFIYDFKLPEVAPNHPLRQELELETEEKLFNQLCELDPDSEWTIDKHNKRRLIRAIEVCLNSDKPFSQHKEKTELPSNVLYLSTDIEREELYQKINNRVDIMFNQGFVDEVRKLHEKYDHNTAMQAAGYKQILQYLDGEIDLATAIAKTKQVHRNFAKRQLTWLRRNADVKWVKNAAGAEGFISKFLI